MHPKIIGICGLKRSGKDTIAQYLTENCGYENTKISRDLKEVIKIMFGFTEEQVEQDEKDKVDARWEISPRSAMQFIGTEVMQLQIQQLLPKIGRRFWIESFIKKHVTCANQRDIVVSDLRFLHEYEELRRHNMFVIRVEKQNTIGHADLHVSETEYLSIPADIIISNDETIEALHAKLSKVFGG